MAPLIRTLPSISRDSSEIFSRNPDLFLQRSTITSSSAPGTTQQPQAFRPSSCTEETLELSGHQRSDGPFVSGILQSPISSPQARRHLQAHRKSKEIKSLSVVRNGNAVLNNSSSSTTSLDYKNRPQRCLSSHSSSFENPQVLPLCYSWKDLSISCWSLNATDKSQEIKSLSGHSVVQNGNAVLNYSSSITTRMDYQNRPQRCLSSHSSSCENPQVFPLCYSWKDLSIPCWSLNTPDKSQEIKSLSEHSVVQIGNAVLNYSSSITTRMDYQNRPRRCLSSHSSSCENPQVFPLCYSWKNLSMSCWSLNAPTCFFSLMHR